MNYEDLRRIFIRFLENLIEELDESSKEFVEQVIKQLREGGLQVTPEIELLVDQWSKEATSRTIEAVEGAVSIVAGAHGMRDEKVARLAEEAVLHRWEDGKDLPARLRDWDRQLKGAVRTVIAQGVARGLGAEAIARELALRASSLPEEELRKALPKYLKEIEEKLKPLVADKEGRRKAKELLREIEKKVSRYARTTRSRASLNALLEDLKRAIDKGSRELVEKAIRVYTHDKLLERLKTIAVTESAYAYGRALVEATPEAVAYRWRLSRSHPKPDICDVYARMDYGLGPGVHPRNKLPRFPAHPRCLCYLIPVAPRKRTPQDRPRLPKRTLRKIAPKYALNLEALGVPLEHLWDEKELRFLKRKELIRKVGEEEFKVLETIGRTLREGRWKERVNKRDVESLKKKLSLTYGDNLPEDITRLLNKENVSSLELHYIKRKYYDGWDLKSPEELDKKFNELVKNMEAVIYRQGDRLAIELGRFIAIIHPPKTKITIFELDEQYESYEDYARQTGRRILKLWQLKRLLERL